MRFANDRQRKAVMAKLRELGMVQMNSCKQIPVRLKVKGKFTTGALGKTELNRLLAIKGLKIVETPMSLSLIKDDKEVMFEKDRLSNKPFKEMTHKIISDLDDYYYNRAIDDQTYLMTENDNGERQGTTDDIPYYIEKNSIHFDSNANYKQTDMNIDMKNLMADAGITISDLKDNDILNYSYNSEADSYLSFVSAEQGISDDMLDKALPIMHGGNNSENEMQIDSIEDEYQRVGKDKGISFDDFKKYMQENQYLKDNLIYTPVNFSYVIWADKDKFIGLIKNKIRNITPEQKQRIKEIKNYRVE